MTPYNLAKVHLFKAVLPVLIILHHFSFFYGYPPYFEKLGLPLVACFFMMSGYGLMTSWLKKGSSYLDGFLKHSTLKLFVPYMLALLAYIPIALLDTQKSLLAYFMETDFIDWLRYSWFVWVLWGGIFSLISFSDGIFPTELKYCYSLSWHLFIICQRWNCWKEGSPACLERVMQ